MQIDELQAFLRCAELGALSAAARAEQLPKSTLSRLLHRLERDLKVNLFERSRRGLVLTDEGRALLPHARRVLETIDTARVATRTFREGPVGEVRLTAPYTFGTTFIAPLLPEFLRAHPGLNVLIELTSRNVDLAGEGFDLAVRVGPPPPGLVAHRLTVNQLLLCASPQYRADYGLPATPAELARHRLLMIGSARAKPALKLSNGRSQVTVRAAARLVSSDPSVIVQAALAGVGIGEVPSILVGSLLAAGKLIPVLVDWSLPAVDVCLIYPRSRVPAPRVKALVEHLRANLRFSDGARAAR